MKNKISKLLFTIVYVLSIGALFAIPNDVLQKGIEYHDLAEVESDGYADKCIELLKPYIDESSIAKAYYGSIITKTASYFEKKNAGKALVLLQKGSDYIDDAIKSDKDNVALHLLRLVNGIQVSEESPLNRYKVLKNDVDYFVNQKGFSQLSGEDLALAYLYCGKYYLVADNIDDALEMFDMAIEIEPNSKSSLEAMKYLRRYEE